MQIRTPCLLAVREGGSAYEMMAFEIALQCPSDLVGETTPWGAAVGCNCEQWDIPLSSTNLPAPSELTLTNKQVIQKTWRWTLVVLHGNQPAFMEQHPPNCN